MKVTVDLDTATANYKSILALANKNKKLWNEGITWYEDAQAEALTLAQTQIHPVLGGDLTRSLRLAAALIAAFSPAKSWAHGVNQAGARKWAAQMAAGLAPTGHFGPNNAKAQALWDACKNGDPSVDELSSILTQGESKVSRFFRNILGDMSPMTIDGHMINAAIHGRQWVPITTAPQTAKNVRICGEALKVAADAYGLELGLAQAVIWVTFKSLEGK
jgi:hypothetical protein